MIVVVGAGLAGLHTVVALRAQGYAGPLILLGAEGLAPYDRPPLTKELLRGDTDDTTLEADWAALDVDRRLSTRALAVEPGVVQTDDGAIGFDALVLATGAQPRRLPGDALTLRTRDDAHRLRAVLRPGARLVVVGAGWIGAEVSTAAVAAGTRVTVLEGADVPHAGALPAEVGARMTPWWSDVDLRFGALVDRARPERCTSSAARASKATRSWSGSGSDPRGGAGRRADGDRRGRGRRGAAQLGARRPRGRRLRGLGVAPVGRTAAASSTGTTPCTRPRSRRPTSRRRRGVRPGALLLVRAVGADGAVRRAPPGGERIVWREDGERWAAFWLAGDRLVAALTVDRPRDLVQARRLIERGTPVDAACWPTRGGREVGRAVGRRSGADLPALAGPWQACRRDRPALRGRPAARRRVRGLVTRG